MITISHNSRLSDTLYKLPNSESTLRVGAGSYFSRINIYDFSTTLPAGSVAGRIEIKRFSSIADQVTLQLFGDHNYESVTTSPLGPHVENYKSEIPPVLVEHAITIGNDVWIGNHAKILSNVQIGNGAVVGSNAVVAKNVPPFSIVVGNPAKIIRFRFDEEVIENIERISWWNWDAEKIRNNRHLLFGDPRDFIRVHSLDL